MKIVVGIDGSEASPGRPALRPWRGGVLGRRAGGRHRVEVPVKAAAYITTEEVDGAMDPGGRIHR